MGFVDRVRNFFNPEIKAYSDSIENGQGIYKAVIPQFLYKPPFGYPRNVDIPEIRRLAATPFVEMCISTIIDEIAGLDWDIYSKEGEGNDSHINEVKKFFENPNSNKESFEQILRMTLRDILSIDSGVIIKVYDEKRNLCEIYARDGGTFTKNPDIFGTFANNADYVPPIPNEFQGTNDTVISEYYKWLQDLPEQPAYFQYGWITGARPMPFGKKEVVYMMRNPRTDSIYGRSPVEILINVIQMLVYGIDHNLEYFTENEVPKGVFKMIGADADAIKNFKKSWINNLKLKNDVGDWRIGWHKMPVINTDGSFERLSFSNAELELIQQQEWFTKLVWACYDNKTEILTENGWKLFKDLNDEKVARVNPENLNIDYVKPIDKQEYDFDGEMIKYKTKSCDLLVTPEHKMLYCNDTKFYNNEIKWESKQAKDFTRGIIPQAGIFKGEKIDKLTFNDLEISGNDFCKFMGIWLSDGWIESSNNRVCLCASDVYPENKEFIENLLKDMNIDYSLKTSKPNTIINGKEININGNMNCYRFSNSELHDYLIQFGKSHDKYIPEIIKNSSLEQRKMFVDSFMLGDGSKGRKGKNDKFGSMSKKLMDDLQEILIKSGTSATLFKNNSNDCWELTSRKTKTDKIKNKYYSRITNDSVTKENYKGKVYDITLPEHHFLIVRRNGRVSISGNCFGLTPSELGYTENSNRATEIIQSDVFKRKAIRPLINLLEYHINTEIIWSDFYDDVEFRFDKFDIEEEKKNTELYSMQINSGIKTINEIREDMGLQPLEGGDEISRQKKVFVQNEEKSIETKPFADYNNFDECVRDQMKKGHDKESAEKICAKIHKEATGEYPGEKKKLKALDTSNPLPLTENEVPLEKELLKLLKKKEKQIIDILEQQKQNDKLMDIKAVDKRIIDKIKKLVDLVSVKELVRKAIEVSFLKGMENVEKETDMNFIPNKEKINFLKEYTFENIKDMSEELANDLRAELERGIMSGEGIPKLKKRVKKVFNVNENRAKQIAITETNRAENMGHLEGYKQTGLKGKKKWVSAKDARTSEICKRLDGQVVGLDEKFKDSVSGWEGLTPPAHVNCRSRIVFETD